MKTNSYYLIILFLLTLQTYSQAQCSNTNQNPADDIIASHYNDTTLVSTTNTAGDYYVIKDLSIGDTYVFLSSADPADYLTIRDEYGTLLHHGTAPLSWTVTGVDRVQVHINLVSPSCGTDSNNRTTQVVCSSCSDIPPGVGVGTTDPNAKLDVNGILKVGNDNRPPHAGMIRWNEVTQDFEGYDGTNWLSLTNKNKNGWGNISSQGTENTKLTAPDGDGDAGDYFGRSVSISGDYAIIGADRDDVGGNSDQGSAYIFHRSGTTWAQQAYITVSDGAASDYFGHSVSISGDYAIVGALYDDVGSNNNQGSAYVFHRSGTTWTQYAKITASDGAPSDYFGGSVSISGDYVIIGAANDDIGSNSNQGSAYIFHRSGTTWTQQVKISADDGDALDFFSHSVSISGDYAVAGANGDDDNGSSSGSAYIFHRSGSTWTQQAKITADDGLDGDSFGHSVSISGDYTIIGAYKDEVGGNSGQGSAYVFHRSGTTWTQQAHITADDGAGGDSFGYSVSISGDYAIIGAQSDEVGGNSSQGSAYVFHRSGTSWSQQAKITADDGSASDNFGNCVSISGDYLIVGAVADDVGSNNNQGSAYIFHRSGTTWTQQTHITADGGAASNNFGTSVSISGDYAIIGVQSDEVGGNVAQGSAYIYYKSGTTWTQQTHITAEDGAISDLFGFNVSISGDYAIVGAYDDDVGSNGDQGSAYIFHRSGTSWTQQAHITASDGTAYDEFGISVSISGDYAIVGAHKNDVGGNSNQGSAYIFHRSGTTWSQQVKITASDGAANDGFGSSISISGDYTIVGADGDDVGGNTDQGSAYIFFRSGTTWTQQAKITASDGIASDNFGSSISISGDYVIVGANEDDVGSNSNQGSAYIFHKSGTTWSQQAKITSSDGLADDQFGISVSISGDYVIVGADTDDVGGDTDQGSAYIFHRSGTAWSQQAKITASDGATTDQFGCSVSMSGNYVIVGAYYDDVGENGDQGSAYIFVH